MRQKLYNRLQQANLFSTIWVDEMYMEGDMNSTIPKAISRSQVVFVLFSADYCESDICRRECNFAINKKIPTYYLFAQKDFKKTQVDWVDFLIENNLYYRIDQDEKLEKLIEALTERFSPSSSPPKPSAKVPKPLPSKPVGNKSYLNRRSLDQWTNADVQEWCNDNNFTTLAQLLNEYDGKTLLALHRILSINSQLSNFVIINQLNIFEVVRFKHKLGELADNPPSVTLSVHYERSARTKLTPQ